MRSTIPGLKGIAHESLLVTDLSRSLLGALLVLPDDGRLLWTVPPMDGSGPSIERPWELLKPLAP